MASFDEFYKSLPEDSNKRGEYFEKVFLPWFLKTDPEWSTQVQEVWLWDDYPQRWGKDCGIDLVCRGSEGYEYVVNRQCLSRSTLMSISTQLHDWMNKNWISYKTFQSCIS